MLAEELAAGLDESTVRALQGGRARAVGGERGLDPPESVLVATTEYRDAESTFDAWIHERLHLDRDAWTSSAALRASYLDWARHNDAEELSARAIGERLGQREGLRLARGAGGVRGWRGIRITVRPT